MIIQDVWMRLEALRELRGMPELKPLSDVLRQQLLDIQTEALKPAQAPAPTHTPRASIERKL